MVEVGHMPVRQVRRPGNMIHVWWWVSADILGPWDMSLGPVRGPCGYRGWWVYPWVAWCVRHVLLHKSIHIVSWSHDQFSFHEGVPFVLKAGAGAERGVLEHVTSARGVIP